MENILISGAGIAGLSLALALKKHGLNYTIIEKKCTLSAMGAGIALPANAVRAMRHLNLSDAMTTLHQVHDIIYTKSNGRLLNQASLLTHPLNIDQFVALDRVILMDLLKQGIQDDIHFNTTIKTIDPKEDGVDVSCSNPMLDGHYSAVIGADGIYSTIRQLGFGQSDLVDLGITTWRWICKAPTQSLQPTYMLGLDNVFLAYPIGADRIYCYAHQADIDAKYHHPEHARTHVGQLFANYKGIAALLLQQLPDSDAIHTGRLRSVPTPQFSHGHLALIGDASSACSPMLQQGAALAFEDAIILAELLAHFPIKIALAHYQSLRFERVNWIVKTSDDAIKKFVQMKSRWSIIARNLFIKLNGPLNVHAWKYLLSDCPLKQLDDLIKTHTPIPADKSHQ